MRRLLAAALATASIAYADVRVITEPFVFDDRVVEVGCIEERDDRTILAIAYENADVSVYLDTDGSGTLDAPRDRIADITGLEAYVYSHDARLDPRTQVVEGPYYRRGVAVIENDADWQGHLAAVKRFKDAQRSYPGLLEAIDRIAEVEERLPTCDLGGLYQGMNLYR